MIHFYKGRFLTEGRLGIFPGTFNPPTLAHLAVAAAARDQYRLDQVVFLLPTEFPHKSYTGASFDDRIAMLQDAAGNEATFAIASSGRGLFIDIAREFRAQCGPGTELFLLCGKDAAERIVHWDYEAGPTFAEQLDEYRLLVASRRGEYGAPLQYRDKILPIDLPVSWGDCSASQVRRAIAEGGNWRQWVPGAVAHRIEQRKLYS
jgi:nicotinate (nicotinamide) nucleotide adenylyltransferase